MQIKFLITLLLALCFFALHYAKQRRQRAYLAARKIKGHVVETHHLDIPQTPLDISSIQQKTSSTQQTKIQHFDLDRGTTLGNFIKVRYQLDGQEKFFETELINRPYKVGDEVVLEYLDNKHIRIQQTATKNHWLDNIFLIIGAIFLVLSIIGFML